jgi:beta-phosphoglucomutase-like phosphatase (HAD superfamily)
MKPKAVYWDMDGTLIDSEPLHDEALVVALGKLGLPPPPKLHERVLGQTAQDVYAMLRSEVGLDLPFDRWIALKYEHYLKEAPKLKPRPGAVEIWHELRARGVVQAVVSNSDRLIVEANIHALGLQEAGLRSYLRAAWLFEIDPADCAVMEDSWPGSQAGLAAGMRTVYWPEAAQPGPAGALVAETADDVRTHLGLS